ncbi:signal peptidase complex catalytic subunit Sec11p [Trichomonascus vanleenenianus]|uniref:signal peptidase complex catalytic subunit SEC11 n=1 Tax=Trichomonascus vanleenenianus TaxID=2268995 RepID=UPI003ECAACF8
MKIEPRKAAQQLLTVILGISTAFMFYKGLAVVSNSSSPIVVVLSGSMEPAFQRGDVLFLWNREHRLKVGDVVVYNVEGRDIPIVHRIMREHSSDRKQLLLTKGDNNAMDDLDLYARRQMYLDREAEIVGTVKGYLPLVGYATILLTENQKFKYALLALVGLSTLFQED